jgi:thiosulfate/3-mercaptopyruvate sulfurtransferase
MTSNDSHDPLVSTAWLAEQLRKDQVTVLDATVVMPAPRFDGDYQAESGKSRWLAGRIPGSRHADLLGDLSDHAAPTHFARPTAEALAAALERLGVGSDRPVVTYDSDGGLWAARLWWMLRWLGLEAVVLDGGWQAWEAAGLPVEAGLARAPVPGRIEIREQHGFWSAKHEVLNAVEGRVPATLVNALAPGAFAGMVPTRYARRGHIPGSRNLPARALVGADGRYLSLDELRRVAAQSVGDAAGPVIAYCGGGISAAGIALTLVRLGHGAVSIYDGSLEEWAADPTLPLVTS